MLFVINTIIVIIRKLPVITIIITRTPLRYEEPFLKLMYLGVENMITIMANAHFFDYDSIVYHFHHCHF